MLRVYLFLVVAILALQLGSTDENTVELNLHGFVGGSVKMSCKLEQPKNVNQLYFQKKDSDGKVTFINGFYSKILDVLPEFQNRTIVNRAELSMELLNLSPADEGEYTCIPFINSVPSQKTNFHLKVTANYSAPTITVQGCGSGAAAHNCVIECSSAGGFPHSNITWSVVGSNLRLLLKDEEDPVNVMDTHSQLWNVSQVITLNCSQPINISCSVGEVVSYAVSVCPSSDTLDIRILIACAVLLLVSIVIIVFAVKKCRRTQLPGDHTTDAELVSLK
ncbi:T-lymphocyte activation antigen CD80 isoform X2 [Silurus meridionalis]|uniref:T-lymphocyte activation antigen CD80 isoform X2 n=1 Tax=Silurus meridionalis TaxID=175797 RepID=UPI001EECD8D1|nr:T-lymphocyte activation antigen CD80 isoform X2 [Silurus meridionalis]